VDQLAGLLGSILRSYRVGDLHQSRRDGVGGEARVSAPAARTNAPKETTDFGIRIIMRYLLFVLLERRLVDGELAGHVDLYGLKR